MTHRPIAGVASFGTVLVLSLATLVAPLLASTAQAARRDGDRVTGCSRYGRGCVSGPIRPARFGQEVRLPGGTWYPCAGDCRETLRAETVDFWDEHQRREGGASRRGH